MNNVGWRGKLIDADVYTSERLDVAPTIDPSVVGSARQRRGAAACTAVAAAEKIGLD
jgi:hypothetical protein